MRVGKELFKIKGNGCIKKNSYRMVMNEFRRFLSIILLIFWNNLLLKVVGTRDLPLIEA